MVDDHQLPGGVLCLFLSNRGNIKLIFRMSSHYTIFPSQLGMIRLWEVHQVGRQ